MRRVLAIAVLVGFLLGAADAQGRRRSKRRGARKPARASAMPTAIPAVAPSPGPSSSGVSAPPLPAPVTEHVVIAPSPHPAESPIASYGLMPVTTPPASPSPRPSASPSPFTSTTPFHDPLLGLDLRLPPGWTATRPAPPVNAVLLAPPSPPFRTNVTVLLDLHPAPLEAYAREVGQRSPLDLGRTLASGTRLTIGGKPAIFVTGAPAHPRLKLSNAQAIVDCGPHKLIFTATSLDIHFDKCRCTFRRVLDTAAIGPRAPLPAAPGTPYRDPDGRFALTLPPRFVPARPERAENVLFVGPVEMGMSVIGSGQVIDMPAGWAATPVQLSILKRAIPGGQTGQSLLDGRVLVRTGKPDALLMLFRYRPADTEIHEVVAEVPHGKLLVRVKFRGPGTSWPLYDAALRASLVTLEAPAPSVR